MLKYKFFFDSNSGSPGENEINKWLKSKKIKIINTSMHNGCLSIFYEEKIENKGNKNEV